jgi:hypothetical protein
MNGATYLSFSASSSLCAAPSSRRLDEEAVLALALLELVRQRRLDLADPALDRLLVDAADERRRMQPQVLARGRSADPRAQQQRRRLDRAGRHHNGRRLHGQRRRRAVGLRDGRLDAARAAVVCEDSLGARADHEPRAVIGGVLEEGLHRRLLAALLAAREAVAADARVLARDVRVASQRAV